MTKRYKTMLTILIILFLAFIGGNYLLDFLFADMCGNDIIQKLPSPDGNSIAYVFIRNCGATTGISYQLSILDEGEDLPNESGNTFVTDKNFSIKWRNEKSLEVIYDRSSETYQMDKKMNGILIDYVGK